MNVELLDKMHRDVALTKAFNGRFVALKRAGEVPGPIHQTEGQEAVGVGVAAALAQDDFLVDYYRGMAQWIARGIDLTELAAELLGRDGLCHGKGGEMSFADPSIGLLNVSGIIGGSIPAGTGAAFACKSYARGQVTAVFFGDGAVNTGAFHEGLNLAASLSLPAVFVCLNNQYGISTAIRDVMAGDGIAARAAAYGIPGLEVDGNDACAVHAAAANAVQRARAGDGPSLLECVTFRIGGHSSTNPEFDFMDEAEFRRFRARDPLLLLRRYLRDGAHRSESELDAVEAETDRIAQNAIEAAMSRPFAPLEIASEGTFT